MSDSTGPQPDAMKVVWDAGLAVQQLAAAALNGDRESYDKLTELASTPKPVNA